MTGDDEAKPPALTSEIYAVVKWGSVEVTTSLVLVGEARQLLVKTSEPIDLQKLWTELLGYFDISVSPTGPWKDLFKGFGVTPFISLSSSSTGEDGKSLAVESGMEFADGNGYKYPQIGGTWKKGPLEISFSPIIQIQALYLSYDSENGIGFRAKVLFLDPPDPGTLALGEPATEPTPQIVEYPFPLPAEKKASNPTFELRYFGLGQRFGPEFDINAPDPMASALTALEDQLTATDPRKVLTDLVQHYYHPDRNWYVGIDLLLRGFRIRVIFNDPVIYGLEITGYDEPLKGLKFEIVYQKLGPHLGVYFGSLTIPDKYRTFNIGAGSLTIPSFSIWIYTNGDFKVSVGWPLGKNSLVIQFYIFIGGGGFYFAKLRSADMPGDSGSSPNYNPVIEFGLAVFLGVGRSITAGPLSAELSLTMQGTFQGVLAWKALENGKAASISRAPDNYWFAASVGLIGVLEGSIDLVVIKVSVSIRISVTVGVAFQLGYKTPVVVSAEVSVRASVKVLFFTIHITFRMHFTHTFVIGSGAEAASMTGPLGDLAAFQPPGVHSLRPAFGVARIDSPTSAMMGLDGSVTGRYLALGEDPGKDLTLTFVLQPTVVYDAGVGKITGVAQLFMDAPTPTKNDARATAGASSFEKLVYAYEDYLLGEWVTWTEVQKELGQGHDDAPAGFRDLVDKFFDQFTVTVDSYDAKPSVEDRTDKPVAVIPMWPKLMVTDSQTGAAAHFSPPGAPVLPVDYDKVLIEYYKKLADFDLSNHGSPRPTLNRATFVLAPGPESLAQKIFSDYFLLLGRQIAAEMVSEAKGDITLHDQAVDSSDLAGRMASIGSRYLLHGQRLPDPAHVPPDIKDVDLATLPIKGLYELTGQQITPLTTSPPPHAFVLELDPTASPPTHPIVWGPTAGATSVTSTLPDGTPPALPDVTPQPIPMPSLTSHPLWYAVRNRVPWSDGTEQSIVPLPEPLLDLASGADDVAIGVSKQAPANDGTIPQQEAVTAALAVKIKLERVKHSATTAVDQAGTTQQFVPDVYQVVGTDDETRELIDRFLLATPPTEVTATLAYSKDSKLVTTEGDAVLAKVSLSTTSQPDAMSAPMEILALQLRALSADSVNPLGPTSATLATPKEFLRLIWEASVVNAPGFLLHVAKIPEDAFGDTGLLEADVIVKFNGSTSSAKLTEYTNALVVDGSTAPFINVTGRSRCLPSFPAGAVGFTFLTTLPDPTEDPYAPATIASLYTLYEFQIQATNLTNPGTPVLSQSLWSQAIGPTTPDDPAGGAADDSTSHQYQRALPVFGFVTNQAPPTNAGLAPLRWQSVVGNDDTARNNRYAAAGATVPIEIVPLDVFGNRLASSAVTPSLAVEYHDPLIPIDEWPGAKLVYDIRKAKGDGADPTMDLTASFNISDVLGADQVVIAAPSGGSKLNTATITVAGTVRNTADTIEIGVTQPNITYLEPSAGSGPPVPLTPVPTPIRATTINPDGTWAVDGITLVEGENLITVTATSPSLEKVTATAPVTYDRKGGDPPLPAVTAGDTFLDRLQTAIARYSVIVDQLADPNTDIELYTSLVVSPVALTQPVDGAVVPPGPMTVTGIVQDPSAAVTVQVGAGPQTAAKVGEDGRFTVEGLTAPEHGAVTVTVIATPKDDQPATSVITIYCGRSMGTGDGRPVPGATSMIGQGSTISDPLYGFVGAVRQQLVTAASTLNAAAKSSGGDVPTIAPLAPVHIPIPIPTETLATRIDDIFMVGAYLRLKRIAHVNAQTPIELPDVAAVASPISPDFVTSDADGGASVSMRGFAASFEAAFENFDRASGLLKLASRPQPGTGRSDDQNLWAIRWGTTSGIDVIVPNEGDLPGTDANAPVYFAPAPLSTSLIGGSVNVPSYDGKIEPTTHLKTFSQIDLDVWAREFVATVGDLLSPAWATAAASLRESVYHDLMMHKGTLAEWIAKGLTWTLADQMATQETPARGDLTSAVDRFEQELLTSLGRDYTTSAIVQVPVDVTVRGVSERGAGLTPRLFGDISLPTLTITEPATGATVAGAVKVAGLVDHRVSEFMVDGTPIKPSPESDGRCFTASVQIGPLPTRIDIAALLDGVVVATSSVTVNTKDGSGTVTMPARTDVTATANTTESRNQHALSNAQLPIAMRTGTPLNFVVTALEDSTHMKLPLNYDVSNLEHRCGVEESEFGYTPSSWLKLALAGPGSVFDFSLGDFVIPLPLRSYPALPVFVDQRSAATRALQSGELDITMSRPLPGAAVNASSVAVDGVVNAMGTLSNLEVTVNGHPAAVSDDGSFRVQNVPLAKGHNVIVARVNAEVGGEERAGASTISIIGISGSTALEALDDVLHWNYRATVRTQNDPHDELWIETKYNVPLSAAGLRSMECVEAGPLSTVRAERLFSAIARFRSGYRDLEPHLEKLPAAAFPDGTHEDNDAVVVVKALEAVVGLVGGVADAWVDVARPAAVVDDVRSNWFLIRYPDRSGVEHLKMSVFALQPSGSLDMPHFPDIGMLDPTTREPVNFTRTAAAKVVDNAPPPPPGVSGSWFESTYSTPAFTSLPPEVDMTLAWPGLRLLETQSATASGYLIRNADLIVGRATNPAFIYTTPTVSFASPAVPSVDIGSFGPLKWEGTVASTITPIFDALAKAETSIPKVIRVAATYEWPAVTSTPDDSGQSLRLLNRTAAFMTPSQVFKQAAPGGYAKTLATQLADWRGLVDVPGSDGAMLVLAITVFATVEGSEVPLVTMREVKFQLVDEWWTKAT